MFLMAFGVGLVPVALAYGAVPEQSLTWLYGLDAPDSTTRHFFRAIMGLYLAMIAFWLAGAAHAALRMAALWSAFVFVTGIASGRLLSLALDGWPRPILLIYLVLEIALAAVSLTLILCGPGRATAEDAG
ncbi:DUF4345 domain-containing protein [Palleronia sp. THAF1]|uniref:DUF4345 domain-containing protein n=1 Tax=Palleronia sp. THAF1 TaxID=2587842 RepID=UPI0020C7A802|nr:DUF4345 domain-containing protein [Palleronia sp. THAF1]